MGSASNVTSPGYECKNLLSVDARKPFSPALHAVPGSLGPPPGCQARSQLHPQPGPPSEPGYPLLSTPPESAPLAPSAERPHPWYYNSIFRPHTFAVFRSSLRGPRGTWRSPRLSVLAGGSRRSGPSSPDPGTRSERPAHDPLKPSPSPLLLPRSHICPFCRAPCAAQEHAERTLLCQAEPWEPGSVLWRPRGLATL